MSKLTLAFLSAALFAVVAGCATVSQLPAVDVSKMENGKVLTAAEITAVVSGKQMIGDFIRTQGENSYSVAYVFEADGKIKGQWPAGRSYPAGQDRGKWRVDENTNELWNSWLRLSSPCYTVTVHAGKMRLYRRDNNSYYLQQ